MRHATRGCLGGEPILCPKSTPSVAVSHRKSTSENLRIGGSLTLATGVVTGGSDPGGRARAGPAPLRAVEPRGVDGSGPHRNRRPRSETRSNRSSAWKWNGRNALSGRRTAGRAVEESSNGWPDALRSSSCAPGRTRCVVPRIVGDPAANRRTFDLRQEKYAQPSLISMKHSLLPSRSRT
jgi:hypothetical protein